MTPYWIIAGLCWLLSNSTAAADWTPLPGAPMLPPAVQQQLEAALTSHPGQPGKPPRSQHLNPDGTARFSNRLALARSPFLLQHAHNPIDWRPWGDEAFAQAHVLNRPILLSIGYSTCHWCHVMEQESFEDQEIARFINEHYIAVLVDREERPDIDSLYMRAALLLNGKGGWPLNVWLRPDGTPFYADTYLPPRDGDRGMPMGFLSYLRIVSATYETQPEQIEHVASQLNQLLQQSAQHSPASANLPAAASLAQAAQFYQQNSDPFYGGLEGTLKFPSGLPLRFMLRYYLQGQDPEILNNITLTLEQMAAGGLRDQLGGGFHRYAIDPGWRVPHFEQMLYDNARLALIYLEAYQVTGRDDFATIARAVLNFMQHDLGAPDGGFYAAIDADSLTPEGELEEGYYFSWTPDELSTVLNTEQLQLAQTFYGVSEHGELDGRSVLYRAVSVPQLAARLQLPESTVTTRLQQIGQTLLEARRQRPAPHRDEKILTAWNGLAITAFATGGWVLNEPAYIDRAEQAATFILQHLRQQNQDGGRLKRSFYAGQAHYNAYLDDYAYLIDGLLTLLQVRAQPRWLIAARELQQILDQHYVDPAGGYFATSDDHETLLLREKPAIDNDLPSGNAVALMNLLRLAELTLDDSYRARADQLLRAFGSRLEQQPQALAEMLLGLDYRLQGGKEIVIVIPSGQTGETLLTPLRQHLYPHRVQVIMPADSALAKEADNWPLLTGKRALHNKPTAYVCEGGTCQLPTSDPAVFLRQLGLAE